MNKLKIKIISFISFVIFVFFVYGVLGIYVEKKYHNALDNSVIQTDKFIKNSIDFLINNKTNRYIDKANRVFWDNEVLNALKNKNRENFYKSINPYFENMKAIDNNFWGLHIILPNNLSFIRVHKPQSSDKMILKGKKPLIDEVNERKIIKIGFDDGKFGYFLRIVYPIFSKDNEFLGVAEFSINVDSLTSHIKNTLGYESLFLIDNVNKKDFLNNLPKSKDNLVIYKSTSDELSKLYIKNIIKNDMIDSLMHRHYSTINIGSKVLKISKVFLSNTAQLAIAFDITNTQKDKKSFEKNIRNLIIILITLSILVWYFGTKYYLKYFTIQEDTKRKLEQTVAQQTFELQQKVIFVEKANNAKSEFLANMSHEIRTPLNAIMGFIELLKEKEEDKEKQKYLNIVNSSSKNLLELMNEILDFSKIESGKFEIDNNDFNTYEEFKVIKRLFKAKADEKNIHLSVSYNELPKYLNSDILRIKQVISNLISNAIKFTPKDKNIFLDIEYSNEKLNVFVKDEGIGISKEYQNNIFEAFTQEDSSTTRKYGGTGLGLTISHRIVKLLGGELKLKSEVDVGSEFYFSIPVELGKNIVKDEENEKIIDFNKKNILLVEDNMANQMFMKVILKKMNINFDIASDGLEAVEMFKQEKYDAILMDENMPNMGGIEATKHILEYEKENNIIHTPIIALTANALKGDRERFLSSGMDEYLTKPLDRKRLSKVLSGFFNPIKDIINHDK